MVTKKQRENDEEEKELQLRIIGPGSEGALLIDCFHPEEITFCQELISFFKIFYYFLCCYGCPNFLLHPPLPSPPPTSIVNSHTIFQVHGAFIHVI